MRRPWEGVHVPRSTDVVRPTNTHFNEARMLLAYDKADRASANSFSLFKRNEGFSSVPLLLDFSSVCI